MNLFRFFAETKEELKKVTWPTKEQTINYTTVVIASVVFCAALIWIIDTFFSTVFRLILQ